VPNFHLQGILRQDKVSSKNTSIRSSSFSLESWLESKDLSNGEEIKQDEQASPKDRPPKGWIGLGNRGNDQSVPINKPQNKNEK
jgi:hypothetical protein